MSKAHKMAKRLQRLEDTHRRDMVRLKVEVLRATRPMIRDELVAQGLIPCENGYYHEKARPSAAVSLEDERQDHG